MITTRAQEYVPGRREARALTDACPACYPTLVLCPADTVADQLQDSRPAGRVGRYHCQCGRTWECWWGAYPMPSGDWTASQSGAPAQERYEQPDGRSRPQTHHPSPRRHRDGHTHKERDDMTSTPQQQKADQLRASLTRAAKQLAADPRLSPMAAQARIAKAYIDTKTTLTALATEHAANVTASQKKLERAIFGVDALMAGASPGDRATVGISFRDAVDRADRLTDPRAAQALLDRAERSGDESLATAVGARAHEQNWPDVLASFTATRPAKATALAELEQSQQPGSAADIFAFALPKPSELGRLTESQMHQLAARTDLQ